MHFCGPCWPTRTTTRRVWRTPTGLRNAAIRGEFIRVQMALAADDVAGPRWTELHVRERMLLAAHESEWLGCIGKLAQTWTFRRGSVEEVTLTAATFLEAAPDVFEAAPVRHVSLRDVGDLLPRLARCPDLGRLEGLSLEGNDLRDSGTKCYLVRRTYRDCMPQAGDELDRVGRGKGRWPRLPTLPI